MSEKGPIPFNLGKALMYAQAHIYTMVCVLCVTAIWTAAMAMLGGGDAVQSQCRTPDIMSDAAYCILTKDSRTATGNFYIDDEVLQADGINDMEQYACVKGMVISNMRPICTCTCFSATRYIHRLQLAHFGWEICFVLFLTRKNK